MNERQQQILLYEWSRRRARGRGGVLLLGAGVGAAGGVAFWLLMLFFMQGHEIGFNDEEMGPWMLTIARALGPVGFMFLLSVPMFAFLGAFVSNRVWFMQEGLYHSLLDQGARVPTEKPRLTWKDYAPRAILIGVTLLIAVTLLTFAYFEINQGNL